MAALDMYCDPAGAPGSEAGRIGLLLGLRDAPALSDIRLADRVAAGLRVTSAEALSNILGSAAVVGPLIPEATLRRARKSRKALSREMSERLYEVGRVVDAAARAYRGDMAAALRFLNRPHRLLEGRSPLDMARTSSAGAEAVINLLRRAEAGVAV